MKPTFEDITIGDRIQVRGGWGMRAPEIGRVTGKGHHKGKPCVDYDREAEPGDTRFAFMDQIDRIVGKGEQA